LKYNGPIVPRLLSQEDSIVLKRLTWVSTFATDGSGNCKAIFKSDPTAGWADWSNLSPLFQEYRFLGMKLEVRPNFPNYGGAALQGGIVLYPVRDAGITALTSYSACYSVDGAVWGNTTDKKVVAEVRMSSTVEAGWQNVRAPAADFGIGVGAFGLTISTTYGQFVATALVQFKAAY